MTTKRLGSNPEIRGGQKVPLSNAVRAGDLVFISGQVPYGQDGLLVAGGFAEKVHQVFANLGAVLKTVDCDFGDVVKCTVWLEDERNFHIFNSIYGQYFGEAPPARTTVQSRLIVPAEVEIEAVAYKPL